ncbi:hypothetical protein OROMI_005986 [Orobanche minor]
MKKKYVLFLFALVIAHGIARNIQNDDMKPSTAANAFSPVEYTENVVTIANAPTASSGDEKNFITYGGVGGWGGVVGYAGVIPALGGIGGASGLGGVGGLGGLGGLGGGGDDGLGGAGGLGGVGGGAGGPTGGIVP